MASQHYTAQLDTILEMLSQGHNSVRLETHTLPLWSITAGFLIGFTGMISQTFSPYIFDNKQRLFVQLFVGSVIFAVIFIDRYLIRKKRQQRDESISPVQKKINSIIWMVSSSCVLLVMFAEQNLPGTHVLFGIFIVISGFCFYVFGLFSTAWLRWAGIIQLVLGTVALFMLSFMAMQIYAACSFAVGGTLIHFLNKNDLDTRQLVMRSTMLVTAIWMSASIIFYGHYKLYIDSDHLIHIPLAEYSDVEISDRNLVVITIPRGTAIPFEYLLEFNLLAKNIIAKWDMELGEKVDIVIENGKPNGLYRIGNSVWLRRRESLKVTFFTQKFYIDQYNIPTIQREVHIQTNRKYPGLNL